MGDVSMYRRTKRYYHCAEDCTLARMKEAGEEIPPEITCCENCPYAVLDTLTEGYDFPSKSQIMEMTDGWPDYPDGY